MTPWPSLPAPLTLLLPWSEYQTRTLEFFTFKYAFVFDALVASVCVGAVCGAVGTFLVLRRLSLLGDAAGHAALPGLCVAFALTGSLAPLGLLLGALGSSLLASLSVGVLSRGARSRPDAAIGIVLSVFFGAGVVLLSWIQRTATTQYAGLNSMLLGNVAGIEPDQLHLILGLSLGLALALLIWFRPLAISTFDEEFARSLGLPTRLIHYALLGALALAVIISVQAVGVILVSAMLIIPASTAMFLTKRLGFAVLLSAALGALAGVLGAWISYIQEGVATGPAMVLVASCGFGLAYVFGPRQGWIHRARARQKKRRRPA